MADAKVTSVILKVGREQTDESLGPGAAVSQTTKVGLIEVSGTPAQVTQVAAGAAIEAECDARITQTTIAPAIEAAPLCRVTQVTLAVVYKPLPASFDQPLQPINPWVILQYSDDGGQTWSNEQWRSPGNAGQYKTRLVWRKLGRARDRVYRIIVSDPCKWHFVDAWYEAELGTTRR